MPLMLNRPYSMAYKNSLEVQFMNLPSIFKSMPNMKNGTQPQSSQQDMFGLGIQVFKIESRREDGHKHKPNKSVGRFRNGVPDFRNQLKKTTCLPPMPPKREKKISAVSTQLKSEHESLSLDIQTGPKALNKQKPPGSIKQLDAIKELKPKPTRAATNKAIDLKVTQKISTGSQITRIHYIQELNTLPTFYSEQSEYNENEMTKAGRKRNQELHDETNTSSFIEAFVGKETPFFDGPHEDYQCLSITDYMHL